MPETNWNKINQFLTFAFGIAWATALYMRFSHMLYGSAESLTLVALLYMPAPAIAAIIVQRFFHNGTLAELGLTIKNVSRKWGFFYTPLLYLVCFLGSLGMVGLLGNIFHIPQFGHLDFSNDHFWGFIKETLETQGKSGLLSMDQVKNMNINFASVLLIVGILMAYIVGFTINLPFTLGEELGWRGLLQKETQHWGFWKSNLFIGSIWGLWHGPIIMMGHNFPNYPVIGIGMMVLFCIALSFVQSYIRFKTRTVLGPAAFHGMINASSGMTLLLIASPNELFGSIAGLAGVFGALLVLGYILIFDKKFIVEYRGLEPPPSV